MRKISITVLETGETHIKENPHQTYHQLDGVAIDFFFNKHIQDREMMYIVSGLAKKLDWMTYEVGKYFFDLNKLLERYSNIFTGCQWMKGIVEIEPRFENGLSDDVRVISFIISREEIQERAPQKIFLSHKGANKDKVRLYYNLLKELGFEPWLDEEDMAAGSKLFRSILQGFKESCAVVFFITPEFMDESYLENEIDYAIREKTSRKSFTIITLQFEGEDGTLGTIPELLESFVWKRPKNDLEGFKEIIKAMPIKVGRPVWK